MNILETESPEEFFERIRLQRGQTVLGPGSNFHFNAVVEGTAPLSVLASAYSKFVMNSLSAIESGAIGMDDGFAYPLTALCHHAVELHLKWLLLIGRGVLDETMSGSQFRKMTRERGHDIQWLWAKTKERLERIIPEGEREADLEALEAYIVQIDQRVYDASRYSFDRQGNAVTFPPGMERINLVGLHEAMQKIDFWLGVLAEDLSNRADWARGNY